jgi:hypothetical protein
MGQTEDLCGVFGGLSQRQRVLAKHAAPKPPPVVKPPVVKRPPGRPRKDGTVRTVATTTAVCDVRR